MWKPQKFKLIYLVATLYVLTLTLPSASAVYWAFGDMLLDHSNAFSLLPHSGFRDAAVILMLIHQVYKLADSDKTHESGLKINCHACMICVAQPPHACSSSRSGSRARRSTSCGRS